MEETCDGEIDFLVEEAEEWVIVDYKTAGVYPEGDRLVFSAICFPDRKA